MANANNLIALGVQPHLAREMARQIGDVTPQPAPTITIADPVTKASVEAGFATLIATLTAAGVITA